MRKIAAPITFQTLQVLSDLQSAASSGFATLAQHLRPDLEPDLRRVIFDQECKMTADDVALVHGDLLMMASTPDQSHSAFVTATIVLLSDRLQFGAGPDDLFWNWEAFHDRYREAEAPVRAAVMNGFRAAHGLKRVTLRDVPSGHDLRTNDEMELRRHLRSIAREMTDEMRDQVANLAPEETVEVHRKALENCLAGSCILSEFGSWFPAEVVEQVSLDPVHEAYAPCTALMILNAFETSDEGGKMAQRYQEHADAYILLPTDIRAPLFAGLRHLHEMDSDWQPYADWPTSQRLDKAIVMPFAKP